MKGFMKASHGVMWFTYGGLLVGEAMLKDSGTNVAPDGIFADPGKGFKGGQLEGEAAVKYRGTLVAHDGILNETSASCRRRVQNGGDSAVLVQRYTTYSTRGWGDEPRRRRYPKKRPAREPSPPTHAPKKKPEKKVAKWRRPKKSEWFVDENEEDECAVVNPSSSSAAREDERPRDVRDPDPTREGGSNYARRNGGDSGEGRGRYLGMWNDRSQFLWQLWNRLCSGEGSWTSRKKGTPQTSRPEPMPCQDMSLKLSGTTGTWETPITDNWFCKASSALWPS